jgi:hypothetical protein
VLIAAVRRDAPARRGALADARRVVVGDEGEAPRCRAHMPPPIMSFHVGRWVIDQRARRSSCRSPRTFRLLAGARTDSARLAPPAHRHLPLPAPARCGAFADERRVVAGDDSGRVRARAEFESMTPFTLVCSPPTFRRHARARCSSFADGRHIVAGVACKRVVDSVRAPSRRSIGFARPRFDW